MKNDGQSPPYTPKESILISGETVLFKLLETADEEALLRFFTRIPEHERECLRHDVCDPNTIACWVQTLDYTKVMPVVAFDEAAKEIVGVSSLHRKTGVSSHIAEVRIVVGPSHRKLGLGSSLIKELITIGTQQGLFFLKAEIIADNRLAIKAFRQLGFEFKCLLDDFFMTRSGQTRDLVLMLKPLRINMEEDFFYVF
jgi:L-amino acid N-acyltransferase YncA